VARLGGPGLKVGRAGRRSKEVLSHVLREHSLPVCRADRCGFERFEKTPSFAPAPGYPSNSLVQSRYHRDANRYGARPQDFHHGLMLKLLSKTASFAPRRPKQSAVGPPVEPLPIFRAAEPFDFAHHLVIRKARSAAPVGSSNPTRLHHSTRTAGWAASERLQKLEVHLIRSHMWTAWFSPRGSPSFVRRFRV
jgi:hypothetical protein